MPTVISNAGGQQNNEETTKLKYITPVILQKWGDTDKIIMEYTFTDGRIFVDEYNDAHRAEQKKADYLLLHKDNLALAVVEAKGLDHRADEGYAQAVDYAQILDVPFAYATNGQDLIEKDMISGLNKTMALSDFPTADELWNRYKRETGMTQAVEDLYTYPYYVTATGKKPRYYQINAINRTVDQIARGAKRILLVMATGTGKTYTAFQIVWRFWKSRTFKKILYLADRNILIDQTRRKDFKPFGNAMTVIDNDNLDTTKEVYLGLYQQMNTYTKAFYRQFPRNFFDLVIVDECHRGSADVDSSWHEILEYFSSAVQIGMTATPKDGDVEETLINEASAKVFYENALQKGDPDRIAFAQNRYSKAIDARERAEARSNMTYFGNPVYTYSLRQGIEDGFLAPYKVVSVELNIDKYGYRPKPGTLDTSGNPVDERVYYQDEFDRKIVVVERRALVAKRITEFMKANDMRYAKTIVFCEDIPHCQEMVRLLENENADLVVENPKYVMQITGDNKVGKDQLDYFIDPSSKYPVIAVTSRLMSTGVDAETCEIVVLDRTVGSMTEFKQIIGRGTRIKPVYECDGEEKSKMYFTILDFRRNYLKFNDPSFDGDPVTVTSVGAGNPFPKPPIKPTPPATPPAPPARVARVRGVNVSIVGEDVQYLDQNGNLVTENLTSCVHNNIVSQYQTEDDMKAAWLLAKDKKRFASELLLSIDWSDNFKIQYGYAVDDYDIILYFGYNVDPPMSKHQRTQTAAVMKYLDTYKDNDEKKEVLQLLLEAYVDSGFDSLKDIIGTFSHVRFKELNLTPLKAVKDIFGTKQDYYKELNTLENKLYE